MKQKTLLLMVSFVLSFLAASWAGSPTGNAKGLAPIKITDTVSAVMQHRTRTVPPPKTAGKDVIAAEINISFPELSCPSGHDPAVTAINKAIQNRLLAVAGEKPAATVDALIDTFGKEYETSVIASPDQPGAWSLKFDAAIRHADGELFSLESLDSVFTGGAHPNSNIVYQVFSMKTGKPLPLTEMIATDKMGELTNVAEKQFRLVRGLKADETYEQAGFQFEQNRFSLNGNFLVSKDGLAFCFNQYEIAPYAMGVTQLVIPWSDLKSIVNPHGPAAKFLENPK